MVDDMLCDVVFELLFDTCSEIVRGVALGLPLEMPRNMVFRMVGLEMAPDWALEVAFKVALRIVIHMPLDIAPEMARGGRSNEQISKIRRLMKLHTTYTLYTASNEITQKAQIQPDRTDTANRRHLATNPRISDIRPHIISRNCHYQAPMRMQCSDAQLSSQIATQCGMKVDMPDHPQISAACPRAPT